MPDTVPSALGLALLTLLARRPATGYDLAAQLKGSVGHFWSASHSQIYPELARLEAAGLVTHEVIDGAGPRPTKRYSASAQGVAALRASLAATPTPDPRRDAELMQVYSLWLLEPEEARQVLLRHRARHAAALAHLEDLDSGTPWEDGPASRYARATLRWGIAAHRARLTWYDELLATL